NRPYRPCWSNRWRRYARPCRWGFLPFGRASIASGYTPATVPGRCPEPHRRRKLHIVCSAANGRAHSFRCVSSPNETRCAGLSFGWRRIEKGASMQKEKKTEIITLRVTPQTKDRIRAKAQELGLTVT